jgi:hypothetical protein
MVPRANLAVLLLVSSYEREGIVAIDLAGAFEECADAAAEMTRLEDVILRADAKTRDLILLIPDDSDDKAVVAILAAIGPLHGFRASDALVVARAIQYRSVRVSTVETRLIPRL